MLIFKPMPSNHHFGAYNFQIKGALWKYAFPLKLVQSPKVGLDEDEHSPLGAYFLRGGSKGHHLSSQRQGIYRLDNILIMFFQETSTTTSHNVHVTLLPIKLIPKLH
jgi:hypothetical protein